MPAVTVVVPARNAAATLERTLAALAGQRVDVDYEVIVVDDGSTDETASLARGFALGPVVAGDRTGPATARNIGARAGSGGVLAFTDADCFPTPAWLACGLRALERAELVQGAVLPDPASRPGPFDRTLHVHGETGLYESANLFVRRELFDRIGGFEDWLGPARGKLLAEDTLFAWRARRAGARTAFAPDALVHHAVVPRSSAGYVAERLRLRYFPALVARIPELRGETAFAHVFLTRRSAAFDLAIAGSAAALVSRRPAAALLAAPYAALAWRQAEGWGWRLGLRVALTAGAADLAGLAALLAGSVRARRILL